MQANAADGLVMSTYTLVHYSCVKQIDAFLNLVPTSFRKVLDPYSYRAYLVMSMAGLLKDSRYGS